MVEVKVVGDAAVAHVMADSGQLLPEDSHDGRTQHVRGARGAAYRKVQRKQKERDEPCSHLRIETHVGFEKPATQKFLPHLAEILYMWRHRDVRCLANEHRWQKLFVYTSRMVICKHVRAVLACHILQHQRTARMFVNVPGGIIDHVVHDDPQAISAVVLCHLVQGEFLQLLRAAFWMQRHQQSLALLLSEDQALVLVLLEDFGSFTRSLENADLHSQSSCCSCAS
mmetsp:Transcript_62814/g.137593  ORF Transcript_62814/g.137593 Transcript_62814/m.137593 type:complete len:226 (-) Transcript_62814:166-843(-)